jgi:hypothetical protein
MSGEIEGNGLVRSGLSLIYLETYNSVTRTAVEACLVLQLFWFQLLKEDDSDMAFLLFRSEKAIAIFLLFSFFF